SGFGAPGNRQPTPTIAIGSRWAACRAATRAWLCLRRKIAFCSAVRCSDDRGSAMARILRRMETRNRYVSGTVLGHFRLNQRFELGIRKLLKLFHERRRLFKRLGGYGGAVVPVVARRRPSEPSGKCGNRGVVIDHRRRQPPPQPTLQVGCN